MKIFCCCRKKSNITQFKLNLSQHNSNPGGFINVKGEVIEQKEQKHGVRIMSVVNKSEVDGRFVTHTHLTLNAHNTSNSTLDNGTMLVKENTEITAYDTDLKTLGIDLKIDLV